MNGRSVGLRPIGLRPKEIVFPPAGRFASARPDLPFMAGQHAAGMNGVAPVSLRKRNLRFDRGRGQVRGVVKRGDTVGERERIGDQRLDINFAVAH